MMRPLRRQHSPPQTAMILIHPTAETSPPAIEDPVTTRAATEVTATRTVNAVETAGVAIGPATAMAAAVARPTPSRRPAARLAAIEVVDAVAVAVTTIGTAILDAVEVVVMATTTGAAAAAVDVHARDRLVVTFTGPAMTDETTATGEIGEVVMMTTAAGEAGRHARIDQSARRRRPP